MDLEDGLSIRTRPSRRAIPVAAIPRTPATTLQNATACARAGRSRRLPITASSPCDSTPRIRPDRQREKKHELHRDHDLQAKRHRLLQPDNQHETHHRKPLPSRASESFHTVVEPEEFAKTRPPVHTYQPVCANTRNCT